MTLQEVLGLLQQRGIRLALEGQQMKVRAAKGALTDDVKALLLQHKTALMQWLLDAQAKQAKSAPIPQRDRANAAPLSYAQQRLWFLDQLDPGSVAYNVPTALLLTGPLDIDALGRVFNCIVQRHDILRTSFAMQGDTAVQIVHDVPALTIETEIHRGDSSIAALTQLVRSEASKPFDLSRAPLLRVRVLRLAADASAGDSSPARWLLIQTLHHIITDGWSTGVLMQEVIALYQAFTATPSSSLTELPLPPLPIQYADFACWQRATLSEQELARKVAFWREKLDGVARLDLPTDRPRAPLRSGRGGAIDTVVDATTRDALQQLASRNGVTLFVVLLAAYSALLHRYTGQTDICIGTPIAGRTRAELQGLIGFFVNTLALRNDVTGNPTFAELITRAQKVMLDATEHQDAPFESVVEAMNLPRDMSTTPLFQTVLVLQNAAQGTSLPHASVSGVQVEALQASNATAKFDLTVNINERASDMLVGIEYDSDLFVPERIVRMAQHFANLLQAVANNPELRIGDIDLLDADERARLLHWSADTRTDYPRNVSLARQFEQVTAATPDAIAVDFDTEQLSYGALNRNAGRLANHLHQHGMQDSDNIAICMSRSPELIVGIVAIVKAGGAYVPLDPDYPDDRLAFMLADTKARLIVTTSEHAQRLRQLDAAALPPLIVVDADAAAIAACDCNHHSAAATSATDSSTTNNANGEKLAYIMYTSGSTGMPKGVMVPQRGITRLVMNTNYIDLGASDVTGHISNVSFDAATLEIWGALLNGGRIAGISKDTLLDREKFKQALIEKNVSVMFITVTLFNLYVAEDPSMFASVKNLLVGGEALDPNKIRAALAANPPARLLNGYGPTENTTFTCCHHIAQLASDATTVPLGRPLANSTVYVLDQYGQLAPIGIAGELVTGGDGVALGYLNRDDLNAQKFVADPFAKSAGEFTPNEFTSNVFTSNAKMYRTGDIVRWREDGTIEMLGRIDDQVKIRGFRIELGEIDAALGKLAEVRECAVIVHTEGDDKLLVAYVVPQTVEQQSTQIARIKLQLSGALPQFMLPHAYVLLDKLPLTSNGKLDRRALPAPDWSAQAASAYVAPTTDTEHALVEIWQGLLAVDRIGIHDSFFELGGHSLLATRAIAAVQQQFNISLPLRKLFENPTIAAVAALMDNNREASTPIPVADRNRYPQLPLSQAQQRLWVVDQMLPGNIAYNMPVAVRLRGALDVTALQKAFVALQRRQASLRTTFATLDGGNGDGQAVQIVHDDVPWNLAVESVSAASTADVEQQVLQLAMQAAMKPFDLRTGPLWRANLYRLADDDHVLLVNIHHIISDGWSMDVMLREIGQLYAHFADTGRDPSDDAPALAPLPIQYGDFSVWQRERLQADALSQELQWWRARMQNAPRLIGLPTDHPRPAMQRYRGATLPLVLSATQVAQLHNYCRRNNVTSYMFLLAAYYLLLARYSNQTDICVGTPSAGRERAELQNLIGFFVNSLVLRGDVSGNPSVEALVQRVRGWTLDAFDHQDIPFDLLIETLRIDRSLAFEPLRQVAFSLMAAPESTQIQRDFSGLTFEPINTGSGSAKVDLTIALGESRDAIGGAIEYNTDLFEADTIATMAQHYLHIVSEMLADPARAINDIALVDGAQLCMLLGEHPDHIEAVLPLCAMQRDLFVDSLLRPDTVENSLGYFIELPASVDATHWQQALQHVANQRAVLRSRIRRAEKSWLNIGYLVIDKPAGIHFTHHDWRSRTPATAELADALHTLCLRPLAELGNALIQYGIVQLDDGRRFATFTTHHAMLDGKSLNQHVHDVVATYHAISRNEPLPSFADKPEELARFNQRVMDQADNIAFWRERLASCEPLEAAHRSGAGSASLQKINLTPEHCSALQQFAEEQKVSIANVLKSALGVMVSMLHQPRAPFRITEVLGGRFEGHQDTLGCYIQNLQLVLEPEALAPQQTVTGLLQYTRNYKKGLGDRQFLSVFELKQLADKSALDYQYNYRDVGLDHEINIDGERCRLQWTTPAIRGVVQLIAIPLADTIELRLHCFDHEQHDAQFLMRFVSVLQQLLSGCKTLQQLTWLCGNEQSQLLQQFNTPLHTVTPLCLHQVFEAQVDRTPDAIAVIDAQRRWSYRELDQFANRLAHRLLQQGAGPETIVGLCVQRSALMTAALLAISKAGSAYAPIDPTYPADRIQYMLEDTSARIVVTEQAVADCLPPSITRVMLDEDFSPFDSTRPATSVQPHNLAYIIYTSGSTGLPKGVQVEHQALFHQYYGWMQDYRFTPGLVHLQMASLSFDVCTGDHIRTLGSGGTLVICPKEALLDPAAIYALLIQHNVRFAEFVPVVLRTVIEYCQHEGKRLDFLDYLIVGSDAWFGRDHAAARALCGPQTRFINSYGVTEATVDSTWYESETAALSLAEGRDGMVPVGRPFAHNRVYVMDSQQRPLPVGVVGELCLGEPGLARGYRNRDDLTANVFVNDPCGTRLYRTADLARWDADGNITLVGRMGNQVKIRGFRIELGEIEAAIVEIPAVHEAVVLAHEAAGIKRLVAYVEAQADASIDSSVLRSSLSHRLPEHMVPALFILVPKMPVTPNGKIDRRALPAPREEDYTGGNFVAPRNATEQGLADLWCEVLGLGKVGVLDSFFHVGGHSLLAVKLATRVRDQFHIDLPLTTIFEQPTIEQLAMYIDSVTWTQQQNPGDNVNDAVATSNDREEFEL